METEPGFSATLLYSVVLNPYHTIGIPTQTLSAKKSIGVHRKERKCYKRIDSAMNAGFTTF